MTYDPGTEKVSRVERRTAEGRSWSRFSYKDRGNLTAAANSDGRKISLGYDGHGRIADVTESGRRFTFTYNRDSRPTSITLKGVGAIRVDYDGKGEISSVASDSGVAMALKVTSLFQNLLEIVRPADVKIGF